MDLLTNSMIERLFDSLLVSGPVAALLFLCLIYQSWKLSRAEKHKQELNQQVFQLATSSISTMKDVQSVLEKVVEVSTARGGKDV